MDNKPLLQDRPPAYSPGMQGAYGYGQQNYGAIPGAPQTAAQPGYHPPPYPYHTATGYGPAVAILETCAAISVGAADLGKYKKCVFSHCEPITA
ncbi:hypothetical protein FKM82_023336 [Ascaphus truei]